MSKFTASILSYLGKAKCNAESVNVEWKITDFVYFPLARNKPLRTPIFKTETNKGLITWWRLLVYFSDLAVEFKIIIYKGGSKNDVIELFLVSDIGEIRVPMSSNEELNKIFNFQIPTEEIFGFSRNSFLSQDTLTIRCAIWQKTIKPERILFHTILQTVNFPWHIRDFNFEDQIKRTVHHQDSLQIIGVLHKDSSKGTHSVRIETQLGSEGFLSLVNCELSIEDDRGYCTAYSAIFPTTGWLFYIDLSEEEDDLLLEIKSLVAIDMEYQPISTKNVAPISDESVAAAASEACSMSFSTIKEDLLFLFRENFDSDTILKAEDKSFPVHKAILSARSKVFRKMFESDSASEGLSGIVNIEDIDSETLERMLVFVYGDALEDMQWEDALTLYCAADEYAIHSLKLRCAEILKAGLTVPEVCQLLVLADNRSDDQLIRVVVEFIRDNDEVISSAEWAELEDRNSKLTTKIIRELYLMQRGSNPK